MTFTTTIIKNHIASPMLLLVPEMIKSRVTIKKKTERVCFILYNMMQDDKRKSLALLSGDII